MMYNIKVFTILKFIFHSSILLLIILSLYPGSLIGFILYGDFGHQPDLIKNPYGTTINHFFSYLYISLLGFFLYINLSKEKFRKLFLSLFFLSITLEILQLIVPKRSFQLGDLIFNIMGVLVAYCIVKIYQLIIKK
jgi:VanZ family protein